MDTGLFIALLNPAISLVLAAAFLGLWLYQPGRPYLAVLAGGYLAATIGFMLQHFMLPQGYVVTRLISGAAFTVSVCCAAGAIAAHYGRRRPFIAIALLAAGGFAAFLWFLFVQREINGRILALNFAFGAISLLVAAELRPVRKNSPVEATLFGLSILAALNFIVRTLLVLTFEGPFIGEAGFEHSVYWTTALLSHALISLLLALCLFTAAALDVVAGLKADSHTDPLSGLLNRRGFEERATRTLAHCAIGRLPVALVLADLDHFKAVNDRHGHAAGDRVIADFAARLLAAAGERGIAGRMGGEEFAVLLPVADLGAARLFAETVRAHFSINEADGLPRGTRVTASFGVAARMGQEGLGPLMIRADEALYRAKQNGRDSVRISYERRPMTSSDEIR